LATKNTRREVRRFFDFAFFVPFSIFEPFFREGAREDLPAPKDFLEKLGLRPVRCLKLRKPIADIELTLGEKQGS